MLTLEVVEFQYIVRKARSTDTANCPAILLERMQLSLPEDVFLNIASRLQATKSRLVVEADVCALGSCNRFWREPYGYDSLWEIFARRRWPSWSLCQNSSSSSETPDKGWRDLYVKRHNEVADMVKPLVDSVQESLRTSQSLDIILYRKILGELKSLQLSFIDVKMLMFKPKFRVLLHLVGLHYCCVFLQAPVEDMVKAVVDSKISEGQVCVQWVPRGRLFHFHLTDEPRSLLASLNEIASSRGHGVLRVLTRGAVHKVMQVQTSLLNPTPCQCCQVNTGLNQDHDVPQGSKFT